MKRKIIVYDETNKIVMQKEFDDETEFLQIWGMKDEEEPIMVLEIIKQPYEKPPFALMKPKKLTTNLCNQ